MLARQFFKIARQNTRLAQHLVANQPRLIMPTTVRMFSEESDPDFQAKHKKPFTNPEQCKAQIQKWVSENDVCLFMKGTKSQPQCGFSRYVAVLLNTYQVKYQDFNVLQDETLRQTIKDFSNWPTIPQIYIKGQFVGGCDIMKEMHEDGSLRELLKKENLIKE